MTTRWRTLGGALLFFPLLACGSSATDSDPGAGGAGSDGELDEVPARTLQIDLGLSSPILETRMAATSDGFAVATFADARLIVARLDLDLAPRWAVEIDVAAVPWALEVDSSDRLVVLAAQSGSPASIVRFDPSGGIERSVQTSEAAPLTDFVLLEDDGLMLSDSTRLDSSFAIVGRGDTRGERVAKTSDGFVFLSARELGMGGRMSGVMLRKTDGEGQLAWQTFASPSAANYGALGVRELPDGKLLGAVAGDTNPGHALFVALFSAKGDYLGASEPQFSIQGRDGYEAPLQFGGAIDLIEAGERTFVSLVANSGALGSDTRTQLAVELSPTGDVLGATTGAGGIAFARGELATFNGSGRVLVTTTLERDCAPSPEVRASEPTVQAEFHEASELSPQVPGWELVEFTPTSSPRTLLSSPLSCP